MLRYLIALALLAASPAANAENHADIVVTACPATQADLEFELYTMMTGAKFQPEGRAMSWRRRLNGPFHILSLERANYMHVDFLTFRTSHGTRLVTKLRWRTSAYEFSVTEPDIIDGVTQAMTGMAAQFPC